MCMSVSEVKLNCSRETKVFYCLFEYGTVELGKVIITVSEEKRTIIP